jgi:general stress protein 26
MENDMNKVMRDEFWHAFADSPFVMIRLEGSSEHAIPMTAQLDKDARHEIWFFAPRGNRIAGAGEAMAQFVSKGHDVFACLHGHLAEDTRQDIRDKHWNNVVEAWYPNGKHDPNILLLRFEIHDAEVWTADLSMMGKLKLLTGSKIKPSQAGQHAVGNV